MTANRPRINGTHKYALIIIQECFQIRSVCTRFIPAGYRLYQPMLTIGAICCQKSPKRSRAWRPQGNRLHVNKFQQYSEFSS
jgi:hypothetical protein